MSSEDAAFLAQLAAAPGDEWLRNVYADWLADHDREPEADRQRVMAPGYRAWAVNRRSCAFLGRERLGKDNSEFAWVYGTESKDWIGLDHCCIPEDWFQLIEMEGKDDNFCPNADLRTECPESELIGAAALAFAKLPPERQAELLAMAPAQPAEGT